MAELHDKEAERFVLGSVLVDKTVIPLVMSRLEGEAFMTKDHQLIYTAVVSCYDERGEVDAVLVGSELEKNGDLKRAGGPEYLYQLQASIVETENTEFYAEIIREKWIRRRLKMAGGHISSIADDEERQLDEVLSEAQEGLFKLSTARREGHVAIGSVIKENLKAIEALAKEGRSTIGVPTGFTDFDLLTSGLQPKDLIILAARPSMGKTTLALNIAQNIAIEQELPVAIFSLEMPAEQIGMRMLASESQIDFSRLRVGNLREEDWGPLADGVERLSGAKLFVSDTRVGGIQSLRAEARRIKTENETLGLVVVDYLQLLDMGGPYRGRVEEISEISRSLKALAWELETPVLACSQLNREVERRPDKRPQLSDIRESGAIEQDADVIAFLYREDYYDENTDDAGLADVIIKKQRNGPTGEFRLQFFKKQMRFENLDLTYPR